MRSSLTLWSTARSLDGTADRVVVHAPMTTPPALIGWCALAVAWMTAATVYLYPGLKEEVDEKRYIHRAEKLHTPVLPLECGRARGIENRDFIREDKHPERCWVTIPAFNSLYRRSLRPLTWQRPFGPICVRASRWRTGRGHHFKPCCEPPVSFSASQRLPH